MAFFMQTHPDYHGTVVRRAAPFARPMTDAAKIGGVELYQSAQRPLRSVIAHSISSNPSSRLNASADSHPPYPESSCGIMGVSANGECLPNNRVVTPFVRRTCPISIN